MATRRKPKKKRFDVYLRVQQYLALKMYYESEAEKGRFTGSIVRAMAEAMHLSESTVYKLKRIVETYPERELKNITNINAAYRQACRLNDAQSECETEEKTTASTEIAIVDKLEDEMPKTAADDTDAHALNEPEEKDTDEVVEGVVVPRRRLEGLIDPSAQDDEIINAICDALRLADHIKKIHTILATTHASQINER